jgi:ArsR family transcriptional regulator
LFVAWNGQFSYPTGNRTPEKPVVLDDLAAGAALSESVAPQGFFAAALVHSRKRELPPGVGDRDDRIGVPAHPAEPVVSPKPGSLRGGPSTVEPFASVAFGTPFTHTGDVADEFVHTQRRGVDLDPCFTGRCSWHIDTFSRTSRVACGVRQSLAIGGGGTAGQDLSTQCSIANGFDISQYRHVSKSDRPLTDGSGCAIAPLAREPLSGEAAAELAIKLKALSDPMRLRLLSVVASHTGGEACVCDLSAGIELSQPTISHHLKVLRTAGLLDRERRGSWVYYRVVPDALQQLSQLLDADTLTAVSPT